MLIFRLTPIALYAIFLLIELPDWIGEDVSHDSRYYNSNLVNHPFNRW